VNPLRNTRYPQKPAAKHRAATLEDILKMFKVANTRDRAIIAFILDTGARAGGVCGLKPEDVNLETRTATVTEKGRKTRQVPFKGFTVTALEAWLKERQPQAEYLFHALDTGKRLKTNGLTQAMGRLGRRAGVKGRSNPHSLRHAFSNAFYTAGEGKYLVELARIMGHRDLRTLIENYVSRTDEHVRAAHDSYSPIDIFAALWEAEEKKPKDGESGE
jgi:integrase/recombinase XerC